MLFFIFYFVKPIKKINFSSTAVHLLPDILEEIEVLLYYGDKDLVCNYYGAQRMISKLHWNGKTGFGVNEIKKKKDYVSEFPNWTEVIEKRNHLISLFWNEGNKSDVKIELVLNV